MLVSFIVSSIDFRQFQNFLLSESSTVFSSCKSLEFTNSFFLWFTRSLCCLKTVWYSSLNVKLRGSRCFLLASFRSSCLLRRHSLSNHFLLKDILCRLFLVVFIFRHRFAVVVKIVSTASWEVITFSDGTVSSRNPGGYFIHVWVYGCRRGFGILTLFRTKIMERYQRQK